MDKQTKRLYRLKADLVAAAGHPIRLAIIDYLKDGERCVCDIAAHADSERSNVSRHLSVMLKAGIVDCRKQGLRVMYSLKTPCILGFLSCVSDALRERLHQDSALLKRL
ncbi:MAG: winged helix-turn-helix transcriptional regulator [Planctomycetes bacterium]|nr:winged helix-turn-helix transcriptional regulator [Planctomycetota bacterium]